jgi:hypothetical protein
VKGTAIAKVTLPEGTNQMDAMAPGSPAVAIPKIARSGRVMYPVLSRRAAQRETPAPGATVLGPGPSCGIFGRGRRPRRQ